MLILNPEIKEKKQILKELENEYKDLVIKKEDLLNEIESFNYVYTQKFASLLNQILELKEENIYKKIYLRKLKKEKLLNESNILDKLKTKQEKLQAKLDKVLHKLILENSEELHILKKELEIALSEVNSQIKFVKDEKERLEIEFTIQEDEELECELDEAKQDKKEFDEEVAELKEIKKISNDEKKELKKIYRALSKLIHPDLVEETYKKEASEIMSKVNYLYKLNKIDEIKKIYLQVKNNNFIVLSDSLDEIELLQKQIYNIKDKIIEILKEIDEIKSNEIFDILYNKDEYFKNTQKSLEERLNDLKNEKSYLDINIEKYREFKSL